ncbi:tol-pal system protein YbgF [Alsobacter sp. SYSU M60028]|uniref:Cell division coordinator CpoB n=1 Tax=Alsobacter ponti TaxID=2962936 RepID=A0ABT1LF95_9HYPH|nr:tol-pal system protein YbgF [Alsobacter ponti]MCP8940172.1 tol-pal system protein YbgF [Alsobacter ponti]
MTRQFAWAFAALLLLATAAPTRAQDAADLLLRVNRLESQLRQMSGQIEQLQFQNKTLQDRLQKFEQDVEFRFQDMKPAASARPSAGATPAASPPRPAAPPTPQPVPQKRGDAFDPAQQPNAPGAPRVLGSLPSDAAAPAPPLPGPEIALPRGALDDGGLLADDDAQPGPLDLSTAPRRLGGLSAPGLPPEPVPAPGAPLVTGSAPPATSVGTGLAADEYAMAVGLVKQRQYDQAEMALRQFLQTYPRDRMAPEATYWLAETYYQRARYPDAVEQYLKIYKSFGSSRVAPESLLKLSMSLRGMGQPEQACATLGEIGRKYPSASPELRASIEREARRGNC